LQQKNTEDSSVSQKEVDTFNNEIHFKDSALSPRTSGKIESFKNSSLGRAASSAINILIEETEKQGAKAQFIKDSTGVCEVNE
jgi:hypothetical protein